MMISCGRYSLVRGSRKLAAGDAASGARKQSVVF